MTPIHFTVPAVPVAQPRQRHAVIAGHVRNFTPADHPVQAFKACAKMAAKQAYQGPPLTGPISLEIVFVMPRTGKPSWLKRDSRWFAAWKSGARVPHATNRNDRDNLMKSLQDALNSLLWKDDGLIFTGPVVKWMAAHNEQPHVEVTVVSML